MVTTPAPPAHHFDSLQGLRGCAILAVILNHAIGVPQAGSPAAFVLAPLYSLGGTGVALFFVLSGFLITGILTRELGRTGRVSIARFYERRIFRIWPAFYVYLATVAVLALTAVIAVRPGEIIASGLFVWNYAPGTDTSWLQHTWSLAVEEQFYLIWPLVLLLLKPKRSFWVAASIVAISPLIRVVTYRFTDAATHGQLWQMFHVRADSLLVGCLIALGAAVYPDQLHKFQRWLLRWRLHWVAAVVSVAVPVLPDYLGGGFNLVAGYSAQNVALGIVLLGALEETSKFARGLSWRPLLFVGLISFSLYLWQEPFLVSIPALQKLPAVGVLLAFVAATISYFGIERPFLRIKDRRAAMRSARAQQVAATETQR